MRVRASPRNQPQDGLILIRSLSLPLSLSWLALSGVDRVPRVRNGGVDVRGVMGRLMGQGGPLEAAEAGSALTVAHDAWWRMRGVCSHYTLAVGCART